MVGQRSHCDAARCKQTCIVVGKSCIDFTERSVSKHSEYGDGIRSTNVVETSRNEREQFSHVTYTRTNDVAGERCQPKIDRIYWRRGCPHVLFSILCMPLMNYSNHLDDIEDLNNKIVYIVAR